MLFIIITFSSKLIIRNRTETLTRKIVCRKTMAGEEGAGKKRVVTESLGWLTESTIMPKKHRAIAGVGASSIVELKAELYKSQEDSRKSRELSGPDVEYQRAKNKIAPKDPLSVKNRGVDARAHKYRVITLLSFRFLFLFIQ